MTQEGSCSTTVCGVMLLNESWFFRCGNGDVVVSEKALVPERCKLENLGVNCSEVWSLLSESLVEGERVYMH